jgi:hypothetical protein
MVVNRFQHLPVRHFGTRAAGLLHEIALGLTQPQWRELYWDRGRPMPSPQTAGSSSTWQVTLEVPRHLDRTYGTEGLERETGFEPATSCLGSKHSAS